MFFLYLFVFLLAALLGFELISKVPPTLHTPLMSGSNAISGITIVGAILCAVGALAVGYDATGEEILQDAPILSQVLAFFAVAFATINVVGGYMVTDRMLGSFKKKEK